MTDHQKFTKPQLFTHLPILGLGQDAQVTGVFLWNKKMTSVSNTEALPNKSNEEAALIGQKVYLRSNRAHVVGVMVGMDIERGFVMLNQASWVADAGRFGSAVRTGSFNEVECYDPESTVFAKITDDLEIIQVFFDLPTSDK